MFECEDIHYGEKTYATRRIQEDKPVPLTPLGVSGGIIRPDTKRAGHDIRNDEMPPEMGARCRSRSQLVEAWVRPDSAFHSPRESLSGISGAGEDSVLGHGRV